MSQITTTNLDTAAYDVYGFYGRNLVKKYLPKVAQLPTFLSDVGVQSSPPPEQSAKLPVGILGAGLFLH